MNTCKSCAKPIIWGYTIAGRRMPLDPEPVADGNLVLDGRKVRWVTAEDAPETRRSSHFSTCIEAGSHRRRRA